MPEYIRTLDSTALKQIRKSLLQTPPNENAQEEARPQKGKPIDMLELRIYIQSILASLQSSSAKTLPGRKTGNTPQVPMRDIEALYNELWGTAPPISTTLIKK
jgi:hypothetical protein